jgi:hypothetical protein
MEKIKPLLNRPTTYYDESLRGYMVRLAKANNCSTSYVFQRIANQNGNRPLFTVSDLQLQNLGFLTTYDQNIKVIQKKISGEKILDQPRSKMLDLMSSLEVSLEMYKPEQPVKKKRISRIRKYLIPKNEP